jgi:hypothetical protein
MCVNFTGGPSAGLSFGCDCLPGSTPNMAELHEHANLPVCVPCSGTSCNTTMQAYIKGLCCVFSKICVILCRLCTAVCEWSDTTDANCLLQPYCGLDNIHGCQPRTRCTSVLGGFFFAMLIPLLICFWVSDPCTALGLEDCEAASPFCIPGYYLSVTGTTFVCYKSLSSTAVFFLRPVSFSSWHALMSTRS